MILKIVHIFARPLDRCGFCGEEREGTGLEADGRASEQDSKVMRGGSRGR